MNVERRHGKEADVLKKHLFDLGGRPFKAVAASRDSCCLPDSYRITGAAQFWGPVADNVKLPLAPMLCSTKNALILRCLGNMLLYAFCHSQLDKTKIKMTPIRKATDVRHKTAKNK